MVLKLVTSNNVTRLCTLTITDLWSSGNENFKVKYKNVCAIIKNIFGQVWLYRTGYFVCTILELYEKPQSNMKINGQV